MPVSTRAPLRVLLVVAIVLAAPSLAFADQQTTTVDSVIVTEVRNPFDEFAVLTKLPPDPGETGLSHPAPALRLLSSGTPQH